MLKDEILDLGYVWDKDNMMYYLETTRGREYFTEREIKFIEQNGGLHVTVKEDYSEEHPFKYRYLVGVKPMAIWYLVEYLAREMKKESSKVGDFLSKGVHYLALLNNEFTKEEFIEGVDKLEKYGLLKVEWIDRDEALCSLTIKNPERLKRGNTLTSKKRMRKRYHEHGEFEDLGIADFDV
ncbi:MAG: hypothetical protein ACOCRO_01910 [Halanaerobiales bacterium]